jgi:hypothetical protein
MWTFCAFCLIQFATYDDIQLSVALAIWYGRYVFLSPVSPLSSSVICFLRSFCLWMIWRSNAVQHTVSGLPLCNVSLVRVQFYNKVAQQKYVMYTECAKRVAGKRSSDPYKDTTIIANELLADEAWLNQVCIFCIIWKLAVSLTLLCTSIFWQVFRLMATVWINQKHIEG